MIGSEHYQPGAEFGGGRFKIIKKLGEGGMGIVCLADDTMLHETVAVKFLSPQLGHDNEAMDDMRRETRKSRQLSHRNIIRIHDIYHLPGEAPFITMEYIQGQSLSSLKADQIDRIFPWPFLVPIVAQLCDALDYAHEEKIVHRDLKPANMMLDTRSRLKLADFGLAATISDSMVKVSKDMGVSGTPSYMSPQQLAGKPSKATDDIYSLGATLYELLTSKPPFYKGNVLDQIKEADPPTIQERLEELGLENEVPDAVAFTIMACLNKDPAKRPQSAGEVAELMGVAPGSAGHRSLKGNPNASVPLDSPEASEILSRLNLDEPPDKPASARPTEAPQFKWLDPPAPSPATAEQNPVESATPAESAPKRPLPKLQLRRVEPEPETSPPEAAADDSTGNDGAYERAAPSNTGKRYGIIGVVAAVLITGVILSLSGGGKKSDGGTGPAQPDAPAGKQSDGGIGVAQPAASANKAAASTTRFETFGFRSLINTQVLNQATVWKGLSEGGAIQKTEREIPFAGNQLWHLNANDTELECSVRSVDGSTQQAATGLVLNHQTLDGFEFGIAISLNGVGGFPHFRFAVPRLKPDEGIVIICGLKGVENVRAGARKQQLKVTKNAVPESLAALYAELAKASTPYFIAVRFDGQSILLRDSTMTQWQIGIIDFSSIKDFSAGAGARHSVTLADGPPPGPRVMNIKRYYLRSLR